MDIFLKMIQSGGAEQSPTSLEVGKMAQNGTIDVNALPTTSATPPASDSGGFLQKYGLIILGVFVVIVVGGLIFLAINKNQATAAQASVVTSNQSTSSSNTLAVNNNKTVVLQEATVNGETTTNFRKVENGVVTTEATKEDIDKINALRQQNLDFAAQQQKSALDQAEQIKKKMTNIFN